MYLSKLDLTEPYVIAHDRPHGGMDLHYYRPLLSTRLPRDAAASRLTSQAVCLPHHRH